MANETITGCYDKVTGEITYTQGPHPLAIRSTNCEFDGCFIAAGVHAGQIGLTITAYDCDDTYYGCIDTVTGKFEVTLPDICCFTLMGGPRCEYCDIGPNPYVLQVMFTGLSDCDECHWVTIPGAKHWFSGMADVINGKVFTVHAYDYQDRCYYTNNLGGDDFGIRRVYQDLGIQNPDCFVPPEDFCAEVCFAGQADYAGVKISVNRTGETTGGVSAWLRRVPGGTSSIFFNSDYSGHSWVNCIGGSFSNVLDCEDESTSACIGGTATIVGYGAPLWESGIQYFDGSWVKSGGDYAQSREYHLSSSANEPPNATYWGNFFP